MKSKKGQPSLEMIAAVGFLVLLFSSILFLVNQKIQDVNRAKMRMDANQLVEKLGDNIEAVSQQGDSYYRYFSLDPMILSAYDYNFTQGGTTLYIDWDCGNKYPCTEYTRIPTSNFTIHCLDKGNHLNKIYNEKGSIRIICERPELRIRENSFYPQAVSNSSRNNISIEIVNYGPSAVNNFNVDFDSSAFNNTPVSTNIGSLGADKMMIVKKEVFVNASSSTLKNVTITIDPADSINESIENNNQVNATYNIK